MLASWFYEWPKTTTPKVPRCYRLLNEELFVEHYEAWLDADNQNVGDLKALLQPYPADEMQVHLVDPKVGNVRNDEPSLVEPFPNSA
ncbi:MAG: hypothetical protein H7X91_04575 [Burkholderiales bacterium]|nr:hypothetical protein [Burkholderiales bacterium]